jgi:large subunit ribosomal protein L19
MFVVRRIVAGEGVERKFPIHSPKIAKIEVKRSGVARRAKLYYLRDRAGKSTRLREKREDVAADATAKGAGKGKKAAKQAAAAQA